LRINSSLPTNRQTKWRVRGIFLALVPVPPLSQILETLEKAFQGDFERVISIVETDLVPPSSRGISSVPRFTRSTLRFFMNLRLVISATSTAVDMA